MFSMSFLRNILKGRKRNAKREGEKGNVVRSHSGRGAVRGRENEGGAAPRNLFPANAAGDELQREDERKNRSTWSLVMKDLLPH